MCQFLILIKVETTFFFLLKMNQFILSPSQSTFPLTENLISLDPTFLLSKDDDIGLQK